MPDFPRVTAPSTSEIADAVWAYAARTLTGFTGQPRIDLMGEDADFEAGTGTRKSYLDAAISSRSSHTAEDVWAVTTRTLTGFTGQPRIDLLGEDADFEAGSGSRKARIDRLANIPSHQSPTEGTASFATGDTYPKTVTVIDTSGMAIAGKVHYAEGFIDLTQLANGESIKVEESMIIKSAGSYIKYASETYSDEQSLPALYIVTKPSRYGVKVDLVMDSAPSADRSFDYQLFVKAAE